MRCSSVHRKDQLRSFRRLCFILKPSPAVKDQIYEPVVRPLLAQLGLQGITPDRVFTVKHELDEIWLVSIRPDSPLQI